LSRAVLAAEDQRFLSHKGFDFIEIKEAARELFSGKGLRGASTITMQAARTVFLWPARTWGRKLAEAYYTVLIEIFWSKKRILEVYLNTVDWGRGVRGVGGASEQYFRISPDSLSRSQAALLAAILPNPHMWSPTEPDKQVLMRKERILRDMEKMPSLL
jgi:monofunctional biosynthetic peptidoglycan transglycosylase